VARSDGGALDISKEANKLLSRTNYGNKIIRCSIKSKTPNWKWWMDVKINS